MIKVDLFYIMMGLFVGVLIVYALTPPPKVIFKYPTIDNINDTTYVDENGQCYKYMAVQIECN